MRPANGCFESGLAGVDKNVLMMAKLRKFFAPGAAGPGRNLKRRAVANLIGLAVMAATALALGGAVLTPVPAQGATDAAGGNNPRCRASLLRENWIRVADIDRSLKLYAGALDFNVQLNKVRTLSKKLAKEAFEGVEVRTADLCRRRGPVPALRIIEATPDMIDLPLEDQILIMQFNVRDLARMVGRLPAELGDKGVHGMLEGSKSFVFEDYDGNRIILVERYRRAR